MPNSKRKSNPMHLNRFLILILLCANNLFGQTVPKEDFDFLLGKIENVYAGYKDKVKAKEFAQLVNEVKTSTSKDTFGLLSKLTRYFKDHHLSLFHKIILNAKDSNQCNQNLLVLNKYIEKKRLSNHEGYWMDGNNTTVIFLKESAKNRYEGYVVETNKNVPAGFCILKMQKGKNGKYNSDIVSLTWSVARIFGESFFKNDTMLIASSYAKWKKLTKYGPGILRERTSFNYLPEIKIMDSNNVLIHMHDFVGYNAKIYDSLIAANESYIKTAKNLIIDLRNNGGGTTRCYKSLFPYVCTNQIIRGGGDQLCSEGLMEDAKQDLEEYKKLNDTAKIALYEKYIKDLENNKNAFRYINPDTLKCEPKPNTIKNVAIIINHGCRSAAELMLLQFKQSKKVKIFGETTAGAIDYLDMLTYKLPVTKYTLWVGTVRRGLTKENGKYDDMGMKPDIEISDNVEDWVEYVKNYYEKN